MSEFSRETLLNIIETDHVQCGEASALARMALAAMDSSESVELPLDYLQGHKDGLEWAARLAEANHPETGDWLYDDPIELAKAIRKGPDMPPAQPAPVVLDEAQSREAFEKWCTVNIERNKWHPEFYAHLPAREQWAAWNACRAAMLHAGNSPAIPDGYVMVPKVPSQAHLNSIAMRYRHDFYLLNDAQKDSALATARQMYEECSGQGFYTLPAGPQEVR